MAQVSTQFSGTASELSDGSDLGHSTWLPAARHPRAAAGSVTCYVINQVVVLDSTRWLIDVVEELDVAISRALSDELAAVEHLSSAWGVMPTAEGGKAVWAVLAARPGPGGPR